MKISIHSLLVRLNELNACQLSRRWITEDLLDELIIDADVAWDRCPHNHWRGWYIWANALHSGRETRDKAVRFFNRIYRWYLGLIPEIHDEILDKASHFSRLVDLYLDRRDPEVVVNAAERVEEYTDDTSAIDENHRPLMDRIRQMTFALWGLANAAYPEDECPDQSVFFFDIMEERSNEFIEKLIAEMYPQIPFGDVQ